MRKKVLFSILLLHHTLISQSQDAQDIAKKTLQSTVAVTLFNYAYSEKILGSGFVVADNIIATNYHVISLGNEGYIQKSATDTTKIYIKRLIAVDAENDLALFEVENLGMPSIELSNEDLNVGEKIYVAGNPIGLSGTFSDGIVSANRKIEGKQVIQVTAPVSSGSSGGPAVNSKGKVVGVVFSTNKAGQNLNFVIPIEKLIALMSKKRTPIPMEVALPAPSKSNEFGEILTERFNDDDSRKIKGLKVVKNNYSILETTQNLNFVFRPIPGLLYKPDFTIEGKVKTDVDKQSCIYWGELSYNPTNFTNGTIVNRGIMYRFCGKGNVASLGQYTNGVYKSIKDNVTSSAIKNGDFNLLKIHKRVDSVLFSINDSVLFKIHYLIFPGREVGVGSEENKTKVTIDYIRATQATSKNLSPSIADTTAKAVKLLGTINSKYHEFAPIVSLDGQTIYVTRYNAPENFGKEKLDDIFQASLTNANGKVDVISNKQPYNDENANYCFGISNDGGTLYIESILERNSMIRDKSFLNAYSIDKAESKSIPNFKSFYCFKNYSVYQVSQDGNTIISSLKRADTFGGNDLYVSQRDKDGNWSELRNLGHIVNTEYNEGIGYISADNKYLIFSSQGHPGYGSDDLFITERLDSTWLNWSKPINLGPGINTDGDEENPYISLKTNELYFCRNEVKKNNADVYKVKLKENAKANVTIGNLTFNENELEIEIQSVSDKTSNNFSLGKRTSVHYSFINGKKYSIKTYKKNKLISEKELDLSDIKSYQEKEIKL